MLQASGFSELIRIVSIPTASQSVQYVYVKFHNMDVLIISYAKIFLVYGGKVDELLNLSSFVKPKPPNDIVLLNRTASNSPAVHSDIH